MAENRRDAQKMFDKYLLDYMVKRNMHETAAHFRVESNVPQAEVHTDTEEGFLHEWWTILHDMMTSREGMSREVPPPPPPMFNVPTHQLMTQDELRRMQITQAVFATNQQQRLLPTTMQLRGVVGGTSLVSGMPATAGQMPIRPTSHPQEYGRMFNERQQLHNLNRPPVGNMLSNPQHTVDIQPQLNLPTSQAAAAAHSSASPSYLQKQPFQKPIMHQLIAEDGQGIRIGNNSNMVNNGTNGGAALGRGGPEFVSDSDAGTIPMPPEGWLTNFLMNTQEFPPGFLSDKNQQGQQKPRGQRAPAAEGTTAAGPGTSGHTNMVNRRKDLGEPESEYKFMQSFLCADDDENANEEGIRLIEGHDDEHYPQATYHAIQPVRSLKMGKNKMQCCHFSSNGESLVTSGYEKKVGIWKTHGYSFFFIKTHDYSYTWTSAGHSDLVTDIRFQPSTTVFATSSFDKTVQIWDAETPSRSLSQLHGHGEQVLSLDFHPRQIDRLCSSDRNGKIRLWNVSQARPLKVSKGATAQVRFQPQSGKLLALASGNTVSIVDSETYAIQFTLKDHVNDVRSICWDSTGEHIASVSEESARVWSLAGGGKCMHKLMSHGSNFHSCSFHPRVSQALLVGGYKKLVYWSANQRWSTEAHKGIIAAMASSQTTGLIASASQDGSVKLWK